MKKMLLILNEGTDEIFNINYLNVTSQEQVLFELGNMFLMGWNIQDFIDDGDLDLTSDEADTGLFSYLVTKFVTDFKHFHLIETNNLKEVYANVDKQNGPKSIKIYRDKDFVSWNEVKDKLG